MRVGYYEGLAAEIAPAGAALDRLDVADVVARAPLGERPAGAVAEAITATVVSDDADTIRDVVHFTGPLGKTRIVKVMKPESRMRLKMLKPGGHVALTDYGALALGVKPAGS